MQMIVKQNQRIQTKRPAMSAFAKCRTQKPAGSVIPKNRSTAFGYHREEKGTARNKSAPIISHKQKPP
jgi:hypothetical protein